MASQQLPQPQQAIDEQGGAVTRPWYQFFATLQQFVSNLPQMLAASTLLGRGSASSGPVQVITLGSGVAMTGTVLSATGSGGTVTHTGALTAGELVLGNGGADIHVGNLSGDVTTSGSAATTLANTAVTPGTYGDATDVGQFTVDAKGRLTFAQNVAITFPAVTPTFAFFTGGL